MNFTIRLSVRYFSAATICMVAILSMFCLLFAMSSRGQQHLDLFEEGRIANDVSSLPEDTSAILKMIETARNLDQSNPDSAINLLSQTLAASRKLKFALGIAKSLLYLGKAYGFSGYYEKSEWCLENAILYSKTSNEGLELMPEIFNGLGNVHQRIGSFSKAALFYYQGAQFAGSLKSKNYLGNIYNNAAALLLQLGMQRYFDFYMRKAEKVALENNDMALLGTIYQNKGNQFITRQHYDSAKIYFNKALKIGNEHQLNNVAKGALGNLAHVFLLEKKPSQALPYVLEAIAQTPVESAFESNNLYVILGNIYAELREYEKAEAILLSAHSQAKQLNFSRNIIRTQRVLSEMYASAGKYEEAYKHYLVYTRIKDSIAAADVLKNVNLLEVGYRTAIKDQEIIRQEAELKKKNVLIVSISAMISLLLLLFISVVINYQRERKLQLERMRNLQHEQEIEKLKAVMEAEEKERGRIARELHDGIGGMLASIKMSLSVAKDDYTGSLQTKKLDEIMAMVQDTAAEVRKTSHNLMPDALIRHNLEKALMLYCDSINVGNQLQIDLECHGNLTGLDRSVALAVYRICQELVQNIIKHADATQAMIQVMEHENILSITVEDNGMGFDPNARTGGFGLQNLKHRVHSLQGNISIMSAKGRSTTIFIEFDLQLLKKKTDL